MKLQIVENHDAMSAYGANLILETVRNKPDAVLCLPTGNTPVETYQRLVAMNMPKDFWNQVRIVCLDEYFGIEPSDPRSLCNWLEELVIRPLGIPLHHVYKFNLSLHTPEEICTDYEERISALGAIDLCVLGLGGNGHLAFNEPGTDPGARTNVVKLTDATLASNSVYWDVDMKDVPRYGLTLGLGNILESKNIAVLVSGSRKAEILKQLIEGPETPAVPASYLKRVHQVSVIADRESAALMESK